ncbi:MAG: glycosyltransferase family 2 protein [Anaerolinea sp.]|nr:glycosyltransferase family 2 protein [Anaerolinea sp.]
MPAADERASGTVFAGIVTYNSLRDLPACFASLRQQTYPHVRIMVLDNASSDGSADWVRQHVPEAAVIVSPVNLGFGRGHNAILRALRLMPGDYYLALNPDCRLDPGYVQALVDALMRHNADFATGKLLLADESGHPTGYIYSAGQGIRRDGFVINIGERMEADRFDDEREIMLASAAALLLSQRLIAALTTDGALFDPAFFMYAEDIDLGWRARRAGLCCWYVPAVSALHRGGTLRPETRAQALGNLYLSTLRNAYWIDLLTCNLPLMIVSSLARLVLTPLLGLRLIRQVLRGAPAALRARRRPAIPRAEMLRWYRWSAAQPTGQTRGLVRRVQVYIASRAVSRRV